MKHAYTVYSGLNKDELVYIGTTIQKPQERFRWHRNHGKKLQFKILFVFDNEQEMLKKEFELIQKHNPILNKIKNRPQNLNKKLTQEIIDERKGNPAWCQCCFKRRVNIGYDKCYWCSRFNKTGKTNV